MNLEEKEFTEAIKAIDEVLDQIQEALTHLYRAKDWGVLDIFGGGLISSLAKRDNINQSEYYIEKINSSLKVAEKELKDVNMVVPSSVKEGDEFWDLWMDNIFSDIRIQDQVNGSIDSLYKLKDELTATKEKLESRKQEINE